MLRGPDSSIKYKFCAILLTIIIVITALMMIITEPIPLPAIAMYILVAEVYFGIGTANEIASSFMNDAVFFIMGSLMLAVAIIKQGWDTRIALGIIKLTGNKTANIVFGFTAISAILSSFIGINNEQNHGHESHFPAHF